MNDITILMIEDNEGDIFFLQEAFKTAGINCPLYIVKNGDDALSFLYKKPPFVHVPDPQLILLDINLPKKTGLEVLRELKEDNILKTIPVIIFTSSENKAEINNALQQKAIGYIKKPAGFLDYTKVISEMNNLLCQR